MNNNKSKKKLVKMIVMIFNVKVEVIHLPDKERKNKKTLPKCKMIIIRIKVKNHHKLVIKQEKNSLH